MNADISYKSDLEFLNDIDNVKICKNKCIFCFVSQLPKGMRRALYIKDEDFRLSYLFGNFITMTSLTEKELNFIIDYNMSPLYISVHTLNPKKRNFLLQNPNAENIYYQLLFLKKYGIKFHTQLVIIPDQNDKNYLYETLYRIKTLQPALLSIGIVPVGITKYRKFPKLRPFMQKEAQNLIIQVENFKKRFNINYIYIADEFYYIAKKKLPSYKSYKDFPQLENGIGKYVEFEYKFKKEFKKNKYKNNYYAVLCSYSAYSMFKKLKTKFNLNLKIIPVPSKFWGKFVNVAGLLTGSDYLAIIKENITELKKCKNTLISSVSLNDDNKFLDDLTINDLQTILPGVRCCPDNGKDFAKIISN